MIRIELDSVRQDISKHEYVTVSRARCQVPGHRSWVESAGNGSNLQSVCKTLVEMGVTGGAEVFRGKTPVFSTPIDVGRMAKGRLTVG